MSAGKGNTPSTLTLTQIQAENGLWYRLWQVAVDEAYNSKDAKRRCDEISGLPERAVVAMYFGYHPEMKRWAEANMTAGTCEAALAELHKRLQNTHRVRAEQRAVQAQAAPEQHSVPAVALSGDWMDAFMSGPAQFPAQPTADAMKPTARKSVPVATVESFLRKEVAKGPPRLSQAGLIKLAQLKLNCSRETARKAYGRLPEEMLPRRGRPRNSAG
jgi:hypothetical protein